MLRYTFTFLLLSITVLLLAADDLPPGVKDTQNAKDQPPSPEEAVRRFKVPDGFEVTLFAGEPDVRQPIAMTFDDRGRLWVAECYSYPDWIQPSPLPTKGPGALPPPLTKGEPTSPPLTKGGQGGLPAAAPTTPPTPPFARGGDELAPFARGGGSDRILIFEDTDGDGRFDKRTVFLDNLANLSGILWGHGGIWACTAPNLVFIPDRNGDDKPDGPPEIILDGWSTKAKHNVVNGLAWGPDGWLYGCHGILSESKVGRPGDPDEKRTRINCGIWRYGPFHVSGEREASAPRVNDQKERSREELGGLTPPARQAQRFEVVAHGTTNPWGIDWNEHGEAFFVNCVIGHLWHLIPGARYKRMYGLDYNPHAYELIDATSDHLHWGGGDWTTSRGGKGVHSDAGGGHAHSGAMVYLGDNFPDEYRGQIFMANIHGNRLNVNKLERQGCGYVGKRALDFLTSDNEWFRGVAIAYGPDGGVYVTDWCDHGECHDDDGVHRSSGRIYKVIYKPNHKTVPPFDLSKKSDVELVELLKHKNAWWARQAQRLLAERQRNRRAQNKTDEALRQLLKNGDSVAQRRALRTIYASGWHGSDYLEQIAHQDEYIRCHVIQRASDAYPRVGWILDKLVEMAKSDPSPLVRLHLASVLQRGDESQNWPLAHALAQHGEDAEDPRQPLMIWYGIEPAVMEDMNAALTFAGKSKMPRLTRYVYRRLAEGNGKDDAGLEAAVASLGSDMDNFTQLVAFRGLRDGLRGRKSVAMPKSWPQAAKKLGESSRPQTIALARHLALLFDASGAAAALQELVKDAKQEEGARRDALAALVEKRVPDLAPFLVDLLQTRTLRAEAIRGLAAYADPGTPAILLKLYPSLPDAEKQDAIATLASRAKFAHALLDAIEKKQLPRGDVSAFTARQIQDLNDKELSAKLARVWGGLRQSSAEKKKLIEDYKLRLSNDVIARADVPNGKRVFDKHCALCHKLHSEGGIIGPDLTGSDRKNLHYVLENMLDPSAVVGRDYQLTNFLLHDGRLVAGIVVEETARAVTVQTANERLVLAKDDIDQRKTSKVSMMPEGLIEKLTAEELRDLAGYLRR
jgi:putative membrane-bound dehydrogenase-like protein